MNKILLLHGAIGALDQLNPLKEELSGKYEVHSINFTGHGGSEIPNEPFSIEMFADDIIGYIDKNDLAGINIFGYSMGGYAALYADLKKPGKLGKIFTLATKFDWSNEIAEREVKMLDAQKIKQKVPKFAEELSMRHGADKWVTVLEKTSEMMLALGRNNLLTVETLGNMKNEVLVGIGDRDKMVSIEESIVAFRAMPSAKLLVLPGTPHPIEQVDVGRIIQEIKKFII